MGTTKIIKEPRGYKLEGDPVDLNVDKLDGLHANEIDADKVDGKHASELKHGIAEDDETAIKVKIGSFSCPVGTGNYSITTIPFKPRYVDFFIGYQNPTNAIFGNGWMDYNGNQGCVSLGFKGVTLKGNSYSLTNRCLVLGNPDGDVYVLALYVSMNNNGFTINFEFSNPAFTIHWKAVR